MLTDSINAFIRFEIASTIEDIFSVVFVITSTKNLTSASANLVVNDEKESMKASIILEVQLGTFSIKASKKFIAFSIPFAPRPFIFSIASTNNFIPAPKAVTPKPNNSMAADKFSIPLSSLKADNIPPKTDKTATVNRILPTAINILSGSILESLFTAAENMIRLVKTTANPIPKFSILFESTILEISIKPANKPTIEAIVPIAEAVLPWSIKDNRPITNPILRIVLLSILMNTENKTKFFILTFFIWLIIATKIPNKAIIAATIAVDPIIFDILNKDNMAIIADILRIAEDKDFITR